MYSITTTPGFVIDFRPYGEAEKFLSVFTRDLGLVTAMAQGIRLEKSKLRYSSQLYSFGIFSFVCGKEFWRLTSASELLTAPVVDTVAPRAINRSAPLRLVPRCVGSGAADDVPVIARLALLLCRLLHGEEPHPELFDCVFECVKFLNINQLTEEQIQTLESLTVARMLHKLGYIGNDAQLDGYLQSNNITIQLLYDLKSKRMIINKHINKALKESHL